MKPQVEVWRDIREHLRSGKVKGFAAGPDSRVYALICLGAEDESWTIRRTPCDWLVVAAGPEEWDLEEYRIRDQLYNFDFVQPIPNGLLLATGRCEYAEPCRPNARFFDPNGTMTGELLLGDGIQDIQTTTSGEIWVSYFDEGIFGNLGWHRPIGANGLLRFNRRGDRLYEYGPAGGLQSMVDCYAMNAVSEEELWCYYYTEFPLVRMVGDRIVESWECPIKGALVFATDGHRVLMQGGYEQRDEWSLLTVERNGRIRVDWRGQIDPDGALGGSRVTARGPFLWFLKDGVIFHTDIRRWR